LIFSGNYENIPGGVCSSRVGTIGGVKLFGQITDKRRKILVDTGERILMMVVVLAVDS
jgi:hypothetical protein